MYPSIPLPSAAVHSSMAYPVSRGGAHSAAQPPLPAVDVTEVFDPDFKYIYDVPSSAVVHLPPARLNITRLVLCRNYRPYDPQSCAMGGNCKFVHADCDYTKLEAHPIHVNYIWRHENLCTYARLPAGDVLTVWAPNNKQPSTTIPSQRILVTKGSQAHMICLQSVRSGLASPSELEHATPLSHCAHYYFNRMCNRGERCNFIHAVHVDPNVQGDFKRAPGRGQQHMSSSAGRGGEEGDARGGRSSATKNSSSSSTRCNRSNNVSADGQQPKPRTDRPGSAIHTENATDVVNVARRARGQRAADGGEQQQHQRRHRDPVAQRIAPTQVVDSEVNMALRRASMSGSGSAEVHRPTPPPLAASALHGDDAPQPRAPAAADTAISSASASGYAPHFFRVGPSSSECSHFSRSPPQQSRPPAQQQQFGLPLSPNQYSCDYGSRHDSDIFNASHASTSGVAVLAMLPSSTVSAQFAVTATGAGSPTVNVITRTRRPGAPPATMPAQRARPSAAAAAGAAAFNDKSSSTTSALSLTTVPASAGDSGTAMPAPHGHGPATDSPYSTSLVATAPAFAAGDTHAASRHNARTAPPPPSSCASAAALEETGPRCSSSSGPAYRRQSARRASSHSSGDHGDSGTVHSHAMSFAASPVTLGRSVAAGAPSNSRGTTSPSDASPSAEQSATSSAALLPHGLASAYDGDYEDDAEQSVSAEGPSSPLPLSHAVSRSAAHAESGRAGGGGGGGVASSAMNSSNAGLEPSLPVFRLERDGQANSESDVGSNALDHSTSMPRTGRFRHDPYTSGNSQRCYPGRSPTFEDT